MTRPCLTAWQDRVLTLGRTLVVSRMARSAMSPEKRALLCLGKENIQSLGFACPGPNELLYTRRCKRYEEPCCSELLSPKRGGWTFNFCGSKKTRKKKKKKKIQRARKMKKAKIYRGPKELSVLPHSLFSTVGKKSRVSGKCDRCYTI